MALEKQKNFIDSKYDNNDLVAQVDILACIEVDMKRFWRMLYPPRVINKMTENVDKMMDVLRSAGYKKRGVSFQGNFMLNTDTCSQKFNEKRIPIMSADIPDMSWFDLARWKTGFKYGFEKYFNDIEKEGYCNKQQMKNLVSGTEHMLKEMGYKLHQVGTYGQWLDLTMKMQNKCHKYRGKKVIRWISGEIVRWGKKAVDRLVSILDDYSFVVVEYHYFYQKPDEYFAMMNDLMEEYGDKFRISFDAGQYEKAHYDDITSAPLNAKETFNQLINARAYPSKMYKFTKKELKRLQQNVSAVEWNPYLRGAKSTHCKTIRCDVGYEQILDDYGQYISQGYNDDYPKLFLEPNPMVLDKVFAEGHDYLTTLRVAYEKGLKR